ncbi:MAG: hypothetical protein OXP28_09740 [Gammaproteobacteria bacterium]|nr:hypothetical protein [Gammaproteobacteria bacterium]
MENLWKSCGLSPPSHKWTGVAGARLIANAYSISLFKYRFRLESTTPQRAFATSSPFF